MTRSKKAFGTHYLQSAHIDAFGALFQRNIGPFSEGLNLVYGVNEAGKTTTHAFMGGVLFGWPEARGTRNAYKPAGAERAGTLVFAPRKETSKAVKRSAKATTQAAAAHAAGPDNIICMREKNTEGIKPDPNPAVLADIDEETYRSIFAINADELLGLGHGANITSRLLTAGAGTTTSPAVALNTIQQRLNACLSRSAQFPDSLPNLQAEIDEVKHALDAAEEEAKTFKQEAREYAEIGPKLEETQARLAQLNEEVEQGVAQCGAIERLEAEAEQLQAEHETLLAREAHLAAQEEAQKPVLVNTDMNDAQLRALKEELDDLSIREAQLAHEVEQAEGAYNQAQAHFAALAQSGAHERKRQAEESRRRLLGILAVALPAVFAIAALFMLVFARESESQVPLVAGFAFAFAALLCAGFLSYLLSRQGISSEEEESLSAATVELNKAEQALNAASQRQESFAGKLEHTLQAAGLETAGSNLRYARALLEDLRSERNAHELLKEQWASVTSSRASLDAQRLRNEQDLQRAYSLLGAKPGTPLGTLRTQLQVRMDERSALAQKTNTLSARAGELATELERAKHLKEFDQLKLKHAQLLTRMDETKEVLAQLLLVQRLLEHSIAAWEDKSQPEVYAQASKLFSLMTGGKWAEIRLDAQDQLVVVDPFGQAREPVFLSMGTCQQLYLALRIALLMTAENVGTSIPILADDILVNFDAERRVGAVRALEELARVRQVIVFTCHEEVVALMRDNCAGLNLVEL